MAIAPPYASRKDLENRLSAQTVRRILDDDRDGDPDINVIAALLRDASSKVDSYIALAPGVLLPLDPQAIPFELKRLTLDVAHAMAAQRHPEVIRLDWEKLMKAAETDLERIRDGKVAIVAPSADIYGPSASSLPSRYGCNDPSRDPFYNNDD